MSEKSILSPFRILDWRILTFSCVNPIMNIPVDIVHHWTFKAHVDDLEAGEGLLRSMIQIMFQFKMEYNGQESIMEGQCVMACEMDTGSMEDAEMTFRTLLSRTGMTNGLSNLRVFLLQAGTLHQMGQKRVMLPFINLNNFVFDEEYEFSV